MKATLAVLAAAVLLAAPASAQVRPRVTEGANVQGQATAVLPGNSSLGGVWHLTSPICARLALTKDQNRKVTGAMRMGLCGTPDFSGAEFSCSGFQHANNQFSFVCHHPSGQFHVFMGRVVVEEPVLTQRRRLGQVGQAYPLARLVGRMHQAYFTADPSGAYLIDHPLTGDRVSQ